MAGGVAPLVSLGGASEEVANEVEGFGVGDGVGARSAADGGLVDEDDLADEFGAFDVSAAGFLGLSFAGFAAGVAFEAGFEGFVDDFVDEGGLA